jgi:D-alanyl-lipoteichoic acid acyltransferase DltB (MBOAT superfamily)
MLFPTIDFAVFFVIVFTGSWMLRPYAKPWRWFLVLASCVFYLDPFNPVHTDGQAFLNVSVTILIALVAMGAATSGILRLGFGTVGGPSAVTALGTRGRRGATARAAGDDAYEDDLDGGGTTTLVHDESDGPGPTAAACIWVPALILAILVAMNVWLGAAFPDRPDREWRFLFLLLSVAWVNQALGQAVYAALGPTRERTPVSRWLVRLAIVVNLAVLGYFKYTNWFLETFERIGLNLGVDLPLDIILPIAISFFTFQAISYVVDIGRGELRPIPLLDFTVYLTFFAHLVAGPIVRVKEFAPQLDARADPRYVQSAEAFELIFRGLFKKVVVSSFLASAIVDPVFANPDVHTRLDVLFAILGYAIQIYADFSGYTDIAIGVALLLGIRFPQNFDAPYRSLSLQDFWRRWHITLSRWLRDYLYIPLGGNRKGDGRTYLNLFLTMVIGGLWHGANWTFVVWGVIHGAGLGIERRIKERWATRGPLGLPVAVVKTVQWALTFTIVCLAWVFFRAVDIHAAFAMIGQLFTGTDVVRPESLVTPLVVIVVVFSVLSQFVPERIPQQITVAFSKAPPILQVLAGAVGLAVINVLGPEGVAPFIYFQF